MAKLLVQDLMTRNAIAVRENDDLATLRDVMDLHHIRHVPVVDDEGVVVGLVSHRDLLRRALYATDDLPVAEGQQVLGHLQVGEIMTRDPETVEPRDDLADAGELMLENKFGCLPVVEGERLVGILTEADFVRHLVEAARRARR